MTVASDDDIVNFGESDIARLDGFGDLPTDTTIQGRAHSGRNQILESTLTDNLPTISVATRVWRGGSGCDVLETVADDIGDD